MTNSGDAFRKPNPLTDIDDINEKIDGEVKDPLTPEDEDDRLIEGDLDNEKDEVEGPYEKAFGNPPEKTIKKAVDEDEEALEKDLYEDEQ